MKKRIIKIIAVMLSVVLFAALFSSCESKCKHEVNKWRIVREATCTTEGQERGVCVLCGEVITQTIPVNPENHVYNDWEIVTYPTSTTIGSAKKVCSENPEHVLEVALPAVSRTGSGYKSSVVTKEATVVEEGERTLVLAHETGDLQFTVKIPKKSFDLETASVEDAILMAVSNQSKVRRGNGIMDQGSSAAPFSYEFGDNYTHIKDDTDNKEYWFSVTSAGKIFAVLKEGGGNPYEWAYGRLENMQGFQYMISRANYTRFYGAEGLLQTAYEWATSGTNNKDMTSGRGAGRDADGNLLGKEVYWYHFGYFNSPQYFCQIRVQFTLNEEYALDYLRLDSFAYLREDFDVSLNADNDGICILHSNAQPFYKEYIEFNQVMKSEEPEDPVNPYPENAFQVQDFDVLYGSDYKLSEDPEDSPEFEADKMYNLTLNNITPQTASFVLDSLTIYQLTDTGRRIKLDIAFSNTAKIIAYMKEATSGQNASAVVPIRSHVTGDVKLLFRTASGHEKTIVIRVTPIAPTTLYPKANEYGDNGYTWNQSSGTEMNETIYVGQPLQFSAFVSDDVAGYTDQNYTVQVAGANRDFCTIEDGDGYSTFTASQPGSYVVRMVSAKNTRIYATLRITVEAAPNVEEDILTGVYTGKVTKPTKGDVTVTFSKDADGTIKAEIKNAKGREIMSVYYDVEVGQLKCEHLEGLKLGITLEVNEAYRLVLNNPTGFGSGKEKVVIHHPETTETEVSEQA